MPISVVRTPTIFEHISNKIYLVIDLNYSFSTNYGKYSKNDGTGIGPNVTSRGSKTINVSNYSNDLTTHSYSSRLP